MGNMIQRTKTTSTIVITSVGTVDRKKNIYGMEMSNQKWKLINTYAKKFQIFR